MRFEKNPSPSDNVFAREAVIPDDAPFVEAARGRELIFILSQPRSGSTLLQKILGGHPKIHTLPEPWLMLYLLGGEIAGPEAPFDGSLCEKAIAALTERLPRGRDHLYEGIAETALDVYRHLLHAAGKEFFLDKTPRYYFIIPHLAQMFPQARFIFLYRNPCAVLSSLIEERGWDNLNGRSLRSDLIKAPLLLLSGVASLASRAYVVRYEDLVASPAETMQHLCKWLGLAFVPEILEYTSARELWSQSSLGDKKSIAKHSVPVDNYVNAWRESLGDSRFRYLVRRYLETLGSDVVQQMGYPFEDLRRNIAGSTVRSAMNPRLRAVAGTLLDDHPKLWHQGLVAASRRFRHRDASRVR